MGCSRKGGGTPAGWRGLVSAVLGARVAAEGYLVQRLSAHGAVLLVAERPHLGGAAVAHGVVALPHGEHLHLLTAQHADLLRFLGHRGTHAAGGGGGEGEREGGKKARAKVWWDPGESWSRGD